MKSVEAPVPEKGYSLLRIRRMGVCGTDLHAYKGNQPFFSYPRILGHELAATIEQVGEDSGFQPGEDVSFIPYYSCGKCIACRSGKENCCSSIQVCGVHVDGGMTELLKVPEKALLKSHGLSLDALALTEPLAIGAHGVRRAAIQEGEFAVVIGAGPIGLGAAHFAALAGARVIVVDRDQNRLDFCKNNLPVYAVVNGAETDPISFVSELTNGDMAEAVFDATGNLQAIESGLGYLAHGGRFVLIGLQKNNFSFSHPEFHKREASLMSSRNATKADFETVIDALLTGKVNPETYITHRMHFDEVCDRFDSLYEPGNGLIKAMIYSSEIDLSK